MTDTPVRDRTVVPVMIEIPKGSRNKYEWDEDSRMVRFDRLLFSPVHYPTDYGFIEETLALDGDALDALVLVWEPTFPGCLIHASPVGVFHMEDEKGKDEKILCVPVGDPMWNHVGELEDVPSHLLREIEHFFRIYKDLEEKKTEVGGWDGRENAEEVVRAARERWREAGGISGTEGAGDDEDGGGPGPWDRMPGPDALPDSEEES